VEDERMMLNQTVIASATCVLFSFTGAWAQPTWKPDRPVELIVTCQPSCRPDIAARTIQKIWQDHKIVQMPTVVVNIAGGGGAVAYSLRAVKNVIDGFGVGQASGEVVNQQASEMVLRVN